jgi:uncharacterized protein (TIGR03643 family)
LEIGQRSNREQTQQFLNLFVSNGMQLTEVEIDRIIEMAWEDRTPFDAIEYQFGLAEQQVIQLMRRELKPASWRRWRKRVQGRATKHASLREFSIGRHKCSRQRQISMNKISKR